MRLELPQQAEATLHQIMQREEIKTKSKAIIYLIENHEFTASENQKVKIKNHALEQQLNSLVANLQLKEKAEKGIQQVVSKNVPNAETLAAFAETNHQTVTLQELREMTL